MNRVLVCSFLSLALPLPQAHYLVTVERVTLVLTPPPLPAFKELNSPSV